MRAIFLSIFLAVAATGQSTPSFEKDVAPILANRCIGCHAGNVKMGSLDLDTMAGIETGGNHGTILVPGKSDESRLYLMLVGKAAPAMPLSGEKLPVAEIETIRKWIDGGAPGPGAGFESVSKVKVAAAEKPKVQPRTPVKSQIFSLAWSPAGDLLAAGGFQQVRLVDPATGKAAGELGPHAEVVRGVAFSSDGKLLAAAGGLPGRKGEVKIWNIAERRAAVTIEAHEDTAYAVAFSPDSTLLATSSYDRMIKLWDTATGKEVRTLKDHIDAVYSLAFTPDGRFLISGSADRAVKVWNPATGERLYTLSEPLDGVNAVAVHPGGKLIAAGGLDRTIRLWEIGEKSGTLKNSLIAHEGPILAIAFSRDGSRIVTASADRSVKVFRTADLQEEKVLPDQPDWVTGMRFAPDGSVLAVGRFDGSLSLYEMPAYSDRLQPVRAARQVAQ